MFMYIWGVIKNKRKIMEEKQSEIVAQKEICLNENQLIGMSDLVFWSENDVFDFATCRIKFDIYYNKSLVSSYEGYSYEEVDPLYHTDSKRFRIKLPINTTHVRIEISTLLVGCLLDLVLVGAIE